jgi:FlaA1/EpsC-like NDP-sugar epimerase
VERVLHRLFALPRPYKRSLQLLADTVLIVLSFMLALLLRTEDPALLARGDVWAAPVLAVPVCLIVFYRLGFYRQVVRAMGGQALLSIIAGVAISAITLVATASLVGLRVPMTVPAIYAFIAFCTVGGIRFLLRAIYARTVNRNKTRVVIYGAGQSGRQLRSVLLSGADYVPVAFVDDAPDLHGQQVGGLLVFPPRELDQLVRDYGVEVVLIAIPSISRQARASLVARLQHLPVRVTIMPDTTEMVMGPKAGAPIREVTVEDLLGRDPVPPDAALMGLTITGRVVMVTGAGGSIGSELCRQILAQRPAALLLVEISEFALYTIEAELRRRMAATGDAARIVPLLGSVADGDRMASILKAFAVGTIFHAAAYKHMPLVEQNMVEGISNNVFGTLTIARAAVAAGVENFILVSTDKAVRPTNVMGASKRLAELVCQGLARLPGRTRFAIVRFGNVLGSSGSVIPLFREQIAAGGPVTVTHPEVARYFMTVTEAAQLVIQAGGLARGGEIFALDMGQPVRIVDLARHMIRLSGYVPLAPGETSAEAQARPQDVIRIVYTGMRTGEKLVEELIADGDAMPTAHPRILSIAEASLPWDQLWRTIDRLREACRAGDLVRVRRILATAPTGYRPAATIVDPTWREVAEPNPAAAAEPAPERAPAEPILVEVPEAANAPGMPPFRDRPAAVAPPVRPLAAGS